MTSHSVPTIRAILLASLAFPCAAGPAPAAAGGYGAQARNAAAVPGKIRSRIAELASPDPVKRAAAAYALGNFKAEAAPAIPDLVRLLGDGTAVTPTAYRKEWPGWTGPWQGDGAP